MKIKIMLLGAVITAFAFNSFATEPLFSPRAKGNQIHVIKTPAATQANVIDRAHATEALLSPRAAGNKI